MSILFSSNKIPTGFESGLYTIMVLIDLLKAFDSATHDILLKKMEFTGFSDETTKWFKYYLSNKKFKVHIRTLSKSLETTYAEFFNSPL